MLMSRVFGLQKPLPIKETVLDLAVMIEKDAVHVWRHEDQALKRGIWTTDSSYAEGFRGRHVVRIFQRQRKLDLAT